MDVTEALPGDRRDGNWSFAARRAGTHSLAIWSTLSIAWLLVIGIRRNVLAYDFHNAYLPAAHAVLAGRSPFPPATETAVSPGTAFVYPPLTGFLATPLTLVPSRAADVVMFAVSILCVLATLRLLNVRDWRCYAVTVLWAPTYSSLQTANVILLVALGLAAVWHFRDKVFVAATIAGAVIALKLFAWPVLIWLVATRRLRAAVACAVAAMTLIVVPWAAIGFAGLSGYPHLLHVLASVQWRDSYTVAALLSAALPHGAAIGLGYGIGLLVLAICLVVSRRDEIRGFALAVAAMVLLSPVVHLDYFVLLLVPFALARPRMHWAWIVPMALWIGAQSGNGADWQAAGVLLVACASYAVASAPVGPTATTVGRFVALRPPRPMLAISEPPEGA